MKIVNFKNSPEHRNIIIDAVYSIGKPFTCIDVMRYIADNEIQGQTFEWHSIEFYLDNLAGKKIISASRNQTSEFVTYETPRIAERAEIPQATDESNAQGAHSLR